MKRPVFLPLLLAACVCLSEARASIFLSNLPTNNGGDGPTTTETVRAVTFKTSSSAFEVTSVTIQLLNYISNNLGTNPDLPVLSFYASSNGNVEAGAGGAPGAFVTTLTAPASTSTASAPFVFAPVTSLVLDANTWYWLVLAGTSTENAFEWVRSGTAESFGQYGEVPTSEVGATFGSQMISNNGLAGTWSVGSNGPHSFEIQGVTVVPEPKSMVLLALGGAVVMALRRRAKQALK